jgi:RNA polymerase sigma factor (TIGR02999 family)
MESMQQDAAADSSWGPLLKAAELQAAGSKERLFAALYSELHHLAEKQLRRNAGIAISPTTLLHETYLGVSRADAEFPDRARFLAYASRVMRNLIIDFARRRQAEKRGGGFQFTQLREDLVAAPADAAADADALARLSDALDELARVDAGLAELVDLKYFCGFSVAEVAALRGVSERTIERDWQKARTALYDALNEPPSA